MNCPQQVNQYSIQKLTSTGSGGTFPYKFNLYIDNVLQTNNSIIGTNTQTTKIWLYKIIETPNTNHTYKTEIISRDGQIQSSSCTVFVNSTQCNSPLGTIIIQ